MNKFKKKLGGADKGFTLVEMLIVVAIIAILIAISIPLINSALEKAKHATDAANERAAKAVILLAHLNGDAVEAGVTFTPGTIYAYDAKAGKLKESKPDAMYGQHKGHADGYIVLKLESAGTLSMAWTKNDVPTGPSATMPTDSDGLCAEKALGH